MKKRIKRILTICLIIVFVSSLTGGNLSRVEAASGWHQDANGWWYENYDGSYPWSSWKYIGGSWYYFDYWGYMQTGWLDWNGNSYYLYPSGAMAKNCTIDGKYLLSDGRAATPGWYQDSWGWWYVNEDGTYPSNTFKEIGGDIFYFDSWGYMSTGWVSINGSWYYFFPSGSMARGMWIDDYYVDVTGVWVESGSTEAPTDGWWYNNGNWYYFLSGVMFTGWLDYGGGNWYYFYHYDDVNGGTPGAMATNVMIDDYWCSAVGVANEGTATAYDRAMANGGTLRGAYDYAASLSYSGRTTYTESWGSGALANQGYYYGTGNCYVMAAAFYNQAICLGYNAHQIAGYVPSISGGLTAHSWVEIDETDGTWVYDPNRTMETGVDAFRVYYGQPGTWVYSNYHRMN
jgi:glucan-binding YG repeat protein